MIVPTYAFPFDPTGTQATNLIQGERRAISPPNWTDFYFIIPLAAPFFRTSLEIVHHPSGRVLAEGVDYYCTHRFHDASLAVGKPIYGSITFLDKTITGIVELKYQTIGGEWTIPDTQIEELLAETLANPRITTWEQIVDLPREFPPIDHQWDLLDMVGMTAIVEKLRHIELAIRDPTQSGEVYDHAADIQNPHQVTKTQVGLGNLENFPIASKPEAEDPANTDRYMTPQRTHEAINSVVGVGFNQHAGDTNNPHQVTKTQVGLGSVENFPMASNVEASTGLVSNRYMSPSTTAAAIQTRFDATVNPHISDTNNPHNVSKTQVGLGNVENYPVATTAQAQAASNNSTYMTPIRVREAIMALGGDVMNNHINAFSNPHAVTKAQVGLGSVVNLGLATLESAQAGTDDSGYMTPRLTAAAISALSPSVAPYDAHLTDQANPHGVTAAQINAYTSGQVDDLLEQKLNINATAANSAQLNGMSSADIIAAAADRFEYPEVDGGVIAGVSWTRIGQYAITLTNKNYDIVLYLTGGDRRTANIIPIYLIKLNISPGAIRLEVDQHAGNLNETSFGYVFNGDDDTITLYTKNAARRNAMSVLVVSDPVDGTNSNALPTGIEPIGITYSNNFRFVGGSPNANAFYGDAVFGINPFQPAVHDNGMMVTFANVVENTDDLPVAIGRLGNLADQWEDFISLSQYDEVHENAYVAGMDDWYWEPVSLSIAHDTVDNSLQILRSPHTYTDYQFEVQISSTGSEAMAAGVCIATVRKHGRDHSLFALRTPGGLVLASDNDELPTDSPYGLFTVGYNLLQADEIVLSAISNGLKWGDGVEHADRGSVGPFNPDNHGWDVNGVCTIRVTRTGNFILIETSEYGSTDVTTGTSYSIILTSSPELELFQGPTAWGLVKFKQSNVRFKLTLRPEYFEPYIDLATDPTNPQFARYNGGNWVSEPMKLYSHFVKPGRLIYSEMTNRLFTVRRNGSLKPLNIMFYTDGDVTVLTE